jgi:uncharacterized membrane protein YbhN (UPF0104 family)
MQRQQMQTQQQQRLPSSRRRTDFGTRAKALLSAPSTRITGTLICLYILATNINLNSAIGVLRSTNVYLLAIGLILTIPAMAAAIVEWGALLGASFWHRWQWLSHLYIRGLVASQLLPTGIAGDVVRIYGSARLVSWHAATAAMAAARLVSTLAIFFWAFLAAVRRYSLFGPWLLAITGGGLLIMIAGVAIIFCSDGLLSGLMLLLRRVHPVWARHATAFIQSLRAFHSQPGALAVSFLAAVLGWAIQFASLAILAAATGSAIDYELYPIGFCLNLFASAVPFALNGLGIKEGVWIGVLHRAGLSLGHSAAVALLADLQMVPMTLISAVLWLTERDRPIPSNDTKPD